MNGYLAFIQENNQKIEKQLEKTIDDLKKIEILQEGKDSYKEKIAETDSISTKELQDSITKLLQTEIDKLVKQIETLQTKEKQEDILEQLEQVISKEDDSLEKVADLLQSLEEVEAINLAQTERLQEAMTIMEDALSDLEELLQNADEQKEGTNLVKEKITQIEEQTELLEEYLAFIEKTNENLEKQLANTSDIFEQKDRLAHTKDIYKEKLDDVSSEDVTNNFLEQQLNDVITEALQEEISAITKQEQEVQEKIEERLADILGDKSELSEANKALANAQEEKYSEEELDAIATLTDNLREKYEEKGAELIYPWLIIFEDYDIKLTLPAIKIKEEIYVPAEELAAQLGADLLKSKTNHVIVIKGKGVLIEYILNDNVVYVNDKKMTVTLPPAKEIQNQVYISLQCFVRAYRLEEATYDDYTILSKK